MNMDYAPSMTVMALPAYDELVPPAQRPLTADVT